MKNFMSLAIAFLAFVLAVICLTSCNVTRTVTTKSESVQRGDSTVITTSTVEDYKAHKY